MLGPWRRALFSSRCGRAPSRSRLALRRTPGRTRSPTPARCSAWSCPNLDRPSSSRTRCRSSRPRDRTTTSKVEGGCIIFPGFKQDFLIPGYSSIWKFENPNLCKSERKKVAGESNFFRDLTCVFYSSPDLDYLTQQQLLDICDQDILSFNDLPVAEREVLWEKRYYLKEIPGALPKVSQFTFPSRPPPQKRIMLTKYLRYAFLGGIGPSRCAFLGVRLPAWPVRTPALLEASEADGHPATLLANVRVDDLPLSPQKYCLISHILPV